MNATKKCPNENLRSNMLKMISNKIYSPFPNHTNPNYTYISAVPRQIDIFISVETAICHMPSFPFLNNYHREKWISCMKMKFLLEMTWSLEKNKTKSHLTFKDPLLRGNVNCN